MERASSLHLDDSDFDRQHPLALLDKCLVADDWEVGAVARSLAERFGQDLADLVITLVRLGPSEMAPNQASYYAFWRTVHNVAFGGGIMRGRLGSVMVNACRERLYAADMDLETQHARHPQHLPLIGAALSAQADTATALVYDFGSTNVKRGIASYRDGALVGLRVHPSLATNGLPNRISGTSDLSLVQELADFITRIVSADWQHAAAAGLETSSHIVASIASYVQDGQPPNYDAGYASLRLLSDNAGRYLSRAASQAIGSEVRFTLSHDGTSAARVFAGQPRTAVIMLGTWLGVGFAPEDATGLRPIAPDFEVAI